MSTTLALVRRAVSSSSASVGGGRASVARGRGVVAISANLLRPGGRHSRPPPLLFLPPSSSRPFSLSSPSSPSRSSAEGVIPTRCASARFQSSFVAASAAEEEEEEPTKAEEGGPVPSSFASSSPSCDNDGTFVPSDRFSDRTNLHPRSKTALKNVLKLSTMTEIQSKTFDAASSGRDVLGRARTGTGKTLAFLLPAIETVLKRGDPPGSNVGVLVVCPTRELAVQIENQAKALAMCHEGMSTQAMFGGSSRKNDVNALNRRLPTVLVATPGRLLDHLETTYVRDEPFADIMSRTRVLVLDETDRLLDMGFRDQIQSVVSYLPPDRQTLLFSATTPRQLRSVMAESMKPDYLTVDCIEDRDPTSHTNAQVDQSHVVLPTESRLVCGPVEILFRLMEDRDRTPHPKIVAFFPTTALVAFYSKLFKFGLGLKVIELHSKKNQDYRTRASDRFRKMKRGALFTSDVSARGVDYPDVTHVVQFGMPGERETYIHRLGRTGRAGKKGNGILVLSEHERHFLDRLDGLDVPVHPEFSETVAASDPRPDVAERLKPILSSVRDRTDADLVKAAENAYRSILGYYSTHLKHPSSRNIREQKEAVVEKANAFARQVGFEEPPRVSAHTMRKMGFDGVRGLNVERDVNERRRSAWGRYDRFVEEYPRGKPNRRGGMSYDEWGRGGGGGGGGFDRGGAGGGRRPRGGGLLDDIRDFGNRRGGGRDDDGGSEYVPPAYRNRRGRDDRRGGGRNPRGGGERGGERRRDDGGGGGMRRYESDGGGWGGRW